MKIEQVRKIKSIESEFLKLSKNDKVQISTILSKRGGGFWVVDSESLIVDMHLFDDDLGAVKVSIEAMSPKQVENLKTILEMLQGSV